MSVTELLKTPCIYQIPLKKNWKEAWVNVIAVLQSRNATLVWFLKINI